MRISAWSVSVMSFVITCVCSQFARLMSAFILEATYELALNRVMMLSSSWVQKKGCTWSSILTNLHSLYSARDVAPPQAACVSTFSHPRLNYTSTASL
jgi:hypothetical protein